MAWRAGSAWFPRVGCPHRTKLLVDEQIDQDQTFIARGASLLTYVASIPLSTRTLVYLSDLLRNRRNQLGSRWRRLDAGRQALLVLAHLRNGASYNHLAAGVGI